MTLSSCIRKSFSQIEKHTAQLFSIAALSCVLANAQAATNYIVGYWERSGTPTVSHLTHLNYAFATIVQSSGSYTCKLNGTAATLTSKFRGFKNSNPNLKILISVGGAGQAPADFTNAAQDPNFVLNCVTQTLGLLGGTADGIDIDWEFPSPSDQQNFADLMTALHSALPLNGLLTAAVGMGLTDNGSPAQNADIPFSSLLNTVNFFNVMAYDAYSTAATTFGAPLFASKISGYGTYNGTVDTTITDLIKTRGVPAGKLVLGIPFYGIGYPRVPVKGSNFGLYETPVSETVTDLSNPGHKVTGFAVAVPYKTIVTQAGRATAVKHCDTGSTSAAACPKSWGQPLAAAPTAGSQEAWIYDSSGPCGFGPSVTTFNDTGSMAAKVKYAVHKGLGGVMVWELMQDTADGAPNAWNTFTIQVPAGANPAYLGVEFDASAFWLGTCYIDSILVN